MARRTSHEASTSYSKQWMYDVFLSFRGEDTRNNFTGHLYLTLKEAGINAFIDENEFRRGEDITAESVQAIQGSKISVIVFSRRYADSSWCLEELVKIMECRKTVGQKVFPIFFDINPSDVRKQTGSFAQAFQTHEERYQSDIDKVQRWRGALVEAANLSGWDLRNTADGHEAKFIRRIIDEISKQLTSKSLFVSVYQVGINSRVKDMCSYLAVGSTDVRIVGIWGMGGIGKTTIAKAIYNKFSDSFEGKSFLANLRESSKQPNGLEALQEKLLSDILPTTKINVGNVHSGIDVIKHRLASKRVLLIIDDVDHMDQLYALSVNRISFGRGSRIIITTRDEQLLNQLEADRIFPAQKMNEKEALELLSWHAFRNYCPSKGYLELSKSVVAYCGGLPLALEVLGSLLFRRSTRDWKSTLEKLKRIPCGKILEQLKVSFEGLSDETERDIFLDVSCFFIGVDKNYVIQVLDGCGFFAHIGISVLLERSLITVSIENKLMMHDLLRDMGRDIIRERSLYNRGKCSRLWHHEDVTDVLRQKSGTEEIHGLTLNLLRSDEASFSTEAFTNMKRLRLLQLNYAQLTGNYKDLSKELRWLCWHGFPLKFIPKDFKHQNLVAIDLQYSNLTEVWEDSELLERLKILNLSHSHYLTRLPDFSNLPNLEQLILEDCISLFQVHPSIGHLQRLAFANLEDCKVLKDLPQSFYRLKSVETLVLSGCSNFENLSEDLGEMESLRTLFADNTAIRSIPSSIVRLKNLKYLSLCGLKRSRPKSLPSRFWSLLLPGTYPKSTNLLPPSLSGLYSLRQLRLRNCGLTNDTVPKDLGSLSSLEALDLGSNSFSRLPSLRGLSKLKCLLLDDCKLTDDAIDPMDLWSLSSLGMLDLDRNSFCILPSLHGLTKLDSLRLNDCTNLREITDLPTSLTQLEVTKCCDLERMPNFSEMSNMLRLEVRDCPKLIEFPGLEKMSNWVRIDMIGCTSIPATVKKTILQGWSTIVGCAIDLSGNDIPEWFRYINNEGDRVSFTVPQEIGCNLVALTVCAVYSCHRIVRLRPLSDIYVYVKNHTKRTTFEAKPNYAYHESSEVLWQGQLSNYMLHLEGGDFVQVAVEINGSGFRVKKVGVNLVTDNCILDNCCTGDPISYDSFLSYDDEEEEITSSTDLANDEASHNSSDEDGPPKRLRSDPSCHEPHPIDQWFREEEDDTPQAIGGTQIASSSQGSQSQEGRRYICMESQRMELQTLCGKQQIQIQQQQLEIERLRQLVQSQQQQSYQLPSLPDQLPLQPFHPSLDQSQS
ncbi:hypothetical protein ABKV19_014021 [Rosa sericea]